MKKLFLALLVLPLITLAQSPAIPTSEPTTEGGIKFEHGLSWKEVQAKAKAENKFIMMDCFTTWCGPCKYMDKSVFPLKETADFYNANFINVKVQFDSTADDNEEVKSWKKDMKEIEKQYAINAYPTYLIFDPNGVVVHRTVGSTVDAKTFNARGKEGLVPETQYYTQLRKYENGEKDPAFLRKIALMAQSAFDTKNANKVGAEYIATITDYYTKDNLSFMEKFTTKSTDKLFAIMLENPEKVDEILGKGKSETKIKSVVFSENVVPVLNAGLRKKDPVAPDFIALNEKLSKAYPAFGAEMAAKAKLTYLQNKKDWPSYQSEVGLFMAKYGEKATAFELNNYAWNVFENCKDLTCVAQALEWSKLSLKDAQNPTFMDTYANILHKLGRTQEAIEWEEKAITLSAPAGKEGLTATLNKMKKGEKTWTEE